MEQAFGAESAPPRTSGVVAREEIYPDDPSVLPEGCEIDGRLARHPVDAIADFVIIGSGAAGATAAMVLAERGYEVAVIEEGEWVRTREFGIDLYPAMRRMYRGAGTAVTEGKSFLALIQGRCVGGSTTINSAIAWRPPANVIDAWAERFGLGDTITNANLDVHFTQLEHDLSVRSVSDEALGENNGLFGVAATKLGFESHRIQRYDRGCEGTASCQTGCRHAKKQGMNITFIPRALHAGARIYTSAKVDRVEIVGDRAVAVRAMMVGAQGPVPLRLRARHGVMVAASTIQTPGILRRSGIDSRALGKHFQTHPGVSIMGMLDRPVQMDFGAAQGFNSLAFLNDDRVKLETLSLPPELAVARLPGFGAGLMRRLANYGNMATWAVVVRAESEGEVHERFGEPNVRFTLQPNDVARARKGLKKLCEMMFALGAREIYPGVHGMPSVITSPDELKRWDDATLDPRGYTMIASHLFGAARMGPDRRTSVVGTDFQTHQARGLYVIDSSIFPTNLGVNPQHTIMAIARLAAMRVADAPLTAL